MALWWLEGRRQKRNELEQWTRRQAEGSAKAEDGATYDIETDKPAVSVTSADRDWVRKQAEQGVALCQLDLGGMYFYGGQGVLQDYVEGHKWVNLAASREQAYAKHLDAMAKQMTAAQVAEAQQRASEWQAAFDARQE